MANERKKFHIEGLTGHALTLLNLHVVDFCWRCDRNGDQLTFIRMYHCLHTDFTDCLCHKRSKKRWVSIEYKIVSNIYVIK